MNDIQNNAKAVINEYKEKKEKINNLINGVNENGIKRVFYTIDELNNTVKEGLECKGKCHLMSQATKTESVSDKFNAMGEDIGQGVQELENKRDNDIQRINSLNKPDPEDM